MAPALLEFSLSPETGAKERGGEDKEQFLRLDEKGNWIPYAW